MIHVDRGAPGDDAKTANDILVCLEKDGPMSRADVAKRLGLSRTTISTLMNRFMDQELVTELAGEDPRGRGRPGIPVDLNTSSWFALGAEFYSSHWVFAIINLKGGVVETRTMQPANNNPKSFIDSLIKGIQLMREVTPGRLLPAVGIGAPGLVNWQEGMIISADDLGWEKVKVRPAVEKATGLSAYVLNRNRATGIAEAKYGQGRDAGNFVYIGVGTGISAAIMLHGNLLHGSSYGAGEIGHITIDPKGPMCGCGRRGCLQAFSAEGALARAAKRLNDSGKLKRDSVLRRLLAENPDIRGQAVYRAALDGDASARACVKETAAPLGMAVGTLITTLNPEKIIIGGPLVRMGPLLVEYVAGEAKRWSMPHHFARASIVASDLDDYAGALGAACLVLRHKLELTNNRA